MINRLVFFGTMVTLFALGCGQKITQHASVQKVVENPLQFLDQRGQYTDGFVVYKEAPKNIPIIVVVPYVSGIAENLSGLDPGKSLVIAVDQRSFDFVRIGDVIDIDGTLGYVSGNQERRGFQYVVAKSRIATVRMHFDLGEFQGTKIESVEVFASMMFRREILDIIAWLCFGLL